MNTHHFQHSRVSIVIPHYNNSQRLAETLTAVKNEIACEDVVEVIVVDNNSDVSPKALVESFGFVFLAEATYLNSPYSARNRGIEKTKGDPVILLDSTCVPQKNWLSNGLKFMYETSADIVSSNIVYEFSSEKPSVSEIWDSVFGVNVKKSIENNQYAPGGSLFIRRHLFNTLGLFSEGIRSGGDYSFTNTAYKKGYRLLLCKDSVVKYPAKKFAALKKKSIRVGKGQIGIWRSKGKFWQYFAKFLLKPFYPPNPINLYKRLKNVNEQINCSGFLVLRICFFDWYLRVLQTYGNLISLFVLVFKKKSYGE